MFIWLYYRLDANLSQFATKLNAARRQGRLMAARRTPVDKTNSRVSRAARSTAVSLPAQNREISAKFRLKRHTRTAEGIASERDAPVVLMSYSQRLPSIRVCITLTALVTDAITLWARSLAGSFIPLGPRWGAGLTMGAVGVGLALGSSAVVVSCWSVGCATVGLQCKGCRPQQSQRKVSRIENQSEKEDDPGAKHAKPRGGDGSCHLHQNHGGLELPKDSIAQQSIATLIPISLFALHIHVGEIAWAWTTKKGLILGAQRPEQSVGVKPLEFERKH